MKVRTLTAGAVVTVIAWVVGSAVLQDASDDATRIGGADRVNRQAVLLTVKFYPDFKYAGPHSVAVTWLSTLSVLDPSIDEGNDVAHQSPYTRAIKAARGAKITAAAVPAKREGSYRQFWTTECWLHKNGQLLGPAAHDGPNTGSTGCRVFGTVR